ncbi:MAG: FAD:protein FMN transferase [Chloroflexales bacterium]
MQQIEFRAMGCAMHAAIDSDEPEALVWLEEAPRWMADWEQHLSRFRPQSELSVLNSNPGRWTPVSTVLWAVLQAAIEAARTTGGLVTPAILNAVEASGYTRDFAAGAWAEESQPTNARPAPRAGDLSDALERIGFDERRRMVRLPADVRLDLGGIAKGWAADEIARRLGAVAPTLIDAGGDIAVSGPMADGSPWPVAIPNPLRPDEQLDLLMLTTGGVATSGRDYRRWRQGEGYAHHIIDPRTGVSAQTDILTATVVGPSVAVAEAGAKAVLITGSTTWHDTLNRWPDTTGLIVLEDATVLRAPTWTEHCWQS